MGKTIFLMFLICEQLRLCQLKLFMLPFFGDLRRSTVNTLLFLNEALSCLLWSMHGIVCVTMSTKHELVTPEDFTRSFLSAMPKRTFTGSLEHKFSKPSKLKMKCQNMHDAVLRLSPDSQFGLLQIQTQPQATQQAICQKQNYCRPGFSENFLAILGVR